MSSKKKILVRITKTLDSPDNQTNRKHIAEKILALAHLREDEVASIDWVNLEEDNGHIAFNSINSRLACAKESFEFLCHANYADIANEVSTMYLAAKNQLDTEGKNKNIAEYETILRDYINNVIDCIEKNHCFKINGNSPTREEILDLLAQADNYTTLLKPKPILVTVSEKEINKENACILQLSIPKPPLSHTIAKGYIDAYYGDDTGMFDEKRPCWYTSMSPQGHMCFDEFMQQLAIKNNKATRGEYNKYSSHGLLSCEDILNSIEAIPSKLREIPGCANLIDSEFALLKKENNFQIIHQHGLLGSSITSSRKIQNMAIQLEYFAKPNLVHMIQTSVEIKVQKYINNFSNETPPLEKQRQIDEYISSLLSNPIIQQTLISPIKLPSFLDVPDHFLHEAKLKAIKDLTAEGFNFTIHYYDQNNLIKKECTVSPKKAILLPTNHALNSAKKVLITRAPSILPNLQPTVCRETKNNIETLIKTKLSNQFKEDCLLNEFKNKIIKKSAEIETEEASSSSSDDQIYSFFYNHLKNKIQSILDGRLSLSPDQHELFLAALTDFYTRELIFIASCVSGKDRLGFLKTFFNTISIYLMFYGELPLLNNLPEQDEAFFDIFTYLFLTWHQQSSAGLNAPGANGQKTPRKYLDAELIAYFKKKGYEPLLDLCDRLANLNEFDTFMGAKIKKMQTTSATFMHMATSLPRAEEEKPRMEQRESHYYSHSARDIGVNKINLPNNAPSCKSSIKMPQFPHSLFPEEKSPIKSAKPKPSLSHAASFSTPPTPQQTPPPSFSYSAPS